MFQPNYLGGGFNGIFDDVTVTRDLIFSGTLTDGIKAVTQSAADNSTKLATTAYVDTATASGGQTQLNLLNYISHLRYDNSNTSYADSNAEISRRFVLDKPSWDTIFGVGNWELVLIGNFAVNQNTEPATTIDAEIYDVLNTTQLGEISITATVSTTDGDGPETKVFTLSNVPSTVATGKLRFKKTGPSSVYYVSSYQLVVRAT
jgi:hypothetical protein